MTQNKFLRILHIFILYGFVSAPLYDQLGAHPTFFVAHDAGFESLVTLAAYLSLGIPLVISFSAYILGMLGKTTAVRTHTFFIWALATLIALSYVREIQLPGAIVISLAAILGAMFAALYAYSTKVREFINYATPIVIALPLIFLFTSPSARIGNYSESGSLVGVTVGDPAPIVVIVFDELDVPSLLNDKREIDTVRFPAFGRLASTGTWYPKATSVHASTKAAVPAILTGLLKNSPEFAPIQSDHPNNLFTWLGGSYSLNVSESITKLCPSELCSAELDNQINVKPSSLLEDTLIVYLYLTLPTSTSEAYLPSIGASWSEFNFNDGVLPEKIRKEMVLEKNSDDIAMEIKANSERDFTLNGVGKRFFQLDAFISGIQAADEPNLHFIHVKLPHVPYEYLPSGRTYLRQSITFPDGVVSDKEAWSDKQELVNLGTQRYFLQVGFVDKMLGRILDQLEQNQLFDKSLIVVTSDHGVSNRTGEFRRRATQTNFADILSVPLIIKYPGQKHKETKLIPASLIDIMPTIADVINADLPWDVDGHSLLQAPFPYRVNAPVLEGFFLYDSSTSEWMPPGEIPISSIDLTATIEGQRLFFPSNIPAEKLVPVTKYSNWLGIRLHEKNTGSVSEVTASDTSEFELIENVKLNSGFLPALFKATLDTDTKVTVAVTLNGIVASIVSTVDYDGTLGFLSTMLPENLFREGVNRLELFLIEEAEQQVVFHYIPIRNVNRERDLRAESATYFDGKTFNRKSIKSPLSGSDYVLEFVLKSDVSPTQFYNNSDTTPPMPFNGGPISLYEHMTGYAVLVRQASGEKKFVYLECNPTTWNKIKIVKVGTNLSIHLNDELESTLTVSENFKNRLLLGKGYKDRYWRGWIEKVSIQYIMDEDITQAYSYP